MRNQSPNTVTVTLTDLDRQMSMPGGYWHKKLGGVQLRISMGMNKALHITSEDENGTVKFRVLRQDQSELTKSRQGSATVKRSDLSHLYGGGIDIELI